MSETLLLEFGTSACGAGGAVMAIGNVEKRNLAKGMDEAHRIGNTPNCMLNAICSGEVENGICHRRFHRHCVNVAFGSVSKEDGSGLRAQHEHMTSAIVLFIAASSLMFANQVLVILVY